MPNHKKLCFVIMGFGKKTDYSTGKTLDLDKTYKNIIKPAVEAAGLQCVRADEIQESGLIDRSMYALLMHADLVVADISTYNPNAIYELGVRHAVRPFSTLILKERSGKIPFDLDHTRIFSYSHLGEDIGVDEASRCREQLSALIQRITEAGVVDSPLYEFISVQPPKLSSAEYKRVIKDLADKEKHVFAISERAKDRMESGEFLDAARLWAKAADLVPTESYFQQQLALATYKSKSPSEMSALSDALAIIQKLGPDESNDPETLGLTGAIYKRMWQAASDKQYLLRAIRYYGKGFELRQDFYNGENLALCFDIVASLEVNEDEKIYYRISAKKVREKLISLLSHSLDPDGETSADNKWIYATLAHCYLALGDTLRSRQCEKKFFSVATVEWERDTYSTSKAQLLDLQER